MVGTKFLFFSDVNHEFMIGAKNVLGSEIILARLRFGEICFCRLKQGQEKSSSNHVKALFPGQVVFLPILNVYSNSPSNESECRHPEGGVAVCAQAIAGEDGVAHVPRLEDAGADRPLQYGPHRPQRLLVPLLRHHLHEPCKPYWRW